MSHRRNHKERMERVLWDKTLKAIPRPGELFVVEGAHGDPLATFRENLALSRHAGLSWWRALPAAYQAALSVESDTDEREDFRIALDATLPDWRAAYEGKPPVLSK